MFRGPTVTQLQPGIQGLLLPNALQRAARVRRRSMDDALGYNVEVKGKARRKSEHVPGKGRELAAAELTALQAELKLANFVEPVRKPVVSIFLTDSLISLPTCNSAAVNSSQSSSMKRCWYRALPQV